MTPVRGEASATAAPAEPTHQAARTEDAQVESVDAASPLDAAEVDGSAASDAGQSACKPGDYQGSFEGDLAAVFLPAEMPSRYADAGTSFGFRLGAPDPSGELPIEEGSARGHSLPLIPAFTWTLTGSLDCSSRQLLGRIQGSWMFDPIRWQL